MELTHTTKYHARKITVGELLADYKTMSNIHFQFYDPKDGQISYMNDYRTSNWDWLETQNKRKLLYILSEISDSLKLSA